MEKGGEADSIPMLGNPDDAWQDIENEELQVYIGCARNYYYQSEGRVLPNRALSILATHDQNYLSSLDIPLALRQRQSNGETNEQALNRQKLSLAPPPLSPLQRSDSDFASMYTPLPPGKCTRILEILPGNGVEIQCLLHVVDVSSPERQQYEALSYGSGRRKFRTSDNHPAYPPENASPFPITCNGNVAKYSLDVTDAIRNLRLAHRSRLVWAPELCIDLANTSDRNHHAGLSSFIYGQAYRVIVCLGNHWEAGTAIASICKVVNVWRTVSGLDNVVPKAVFSKCAEDGNSNNGLFESQSGSPPEPNFSDAWSCTMELFRRPWFSRSWSLGETTLATSIVVCLGDYICSWDTVGLAAAVLRENVDRVQIDKEAGSSKGKRQVLDIGILHAYLMYRVSKCQGLFTPIEFTFHQLLVLARSLGSVISRDRVYSLFGVPTTDNVSDKIILDYDKADNQVDLEITLAIVREEKSLSPIQLVSHDHDRRQLKPGTQTDRHLRLTGLSWVAPWTGSHLQEPIAPVREHLDYAAATKLSLKAQVSNDGGKLAVFGVVVDAVTHIYDHAVHNTYWRGEESRERWFNPPLDKPPAEKLGDLLTRYPITLGGLVHLALTLTCGKNWDGAPVSDIHLHVADFAKCLLRGGMQWSLCPNWYRSVERFHESKPISPRSPHTLDDNRPITVAFLTELATCGVADRFLDVAATVGQNRSTFMTSGGIGGMGPDCIAPNDVLVVFHGLGVPFVVRRLLPSNNYHLVGECYARDIMHGEAVAGAGSAFHMADLKEGWFLLV